MRSYFYSLLILTLFIGSHAEAKSLWQMQSAGKTAKTGSAHSLAVTGFDKRAITLDTGGMFAMGAGEQADIALPGGISTSAMMDRTKDHTLGGHSWLGWAGSGAERGRIIMTEVNGYTFGSIIYANTHYLIEPAQNADGYIIYNTSAPGAHEMALDNDEMIPPSALIKASAAPAPKGPSKPLASGANGAVDIGIFYHSSMRDRWGLGLSARLQFLVQVFDTAMTDSSTSIRANLVHISEITGTQTKKNGDTLMDLTDGLSNADGDFSGVAAIRAAKGIDIVVYIRRFKASTHVSCGQGWLNGGGSAGVPGTGVIGAGNKGFGYNVVSDDVDVDAPPSGSFSFCSVFTLAHETGHNMGNNHDVADSPEDGVFSYSHGYVVAGQFKTINGTGSDTRLGFFSNPSLAKCTDSGGGSTAACGTATADNARSMREQGKNVGTFNAPAARVVSSVLPVSRSIKSTATATAFAAVINPAGSGTATGCKLELPGAAPGVFGYQTTTSANALSGTADTPVDIPAGGVQNFVFSITPGAAYSGFSPTLPFDTFTGADLAIEFSCDNRQSAESIAGLNTLAFLADASDVMDVIALAATTGNTGIVDTMGSAGAFSVAVTNIGIAGTVDVTGETSSSAVAATVTVCETVPSTGLCKGTTSPTAMVSRTLAKDDTATFAFFVAETAPIVADFAKKRIFARFREGGVLRGATSVAVRTAP